MAIIRGRGIESVCGTIFCVCAYLYTVEGGTKKIFAIGEK